VKAPSDERLMRYFDRELDGAEAGEVEEWLTESAEARSLLLRLEQVGDTVRSIGDDMGAGADDIADAVMARLEASEGGAPTAARASASVAKAERRAARRWLAAVPALGLGLAAAAVIAIYFRPHAPPLVGRAGPAVTVSPAEPVVPDPAASELAPASDPAAGASIESVDFGAVAGTIFMVPGGPSSDETDTPVVWLMDEPAPDEGRMAPL
jgi:anti-sigma factor RsiW